MSDASRYPTGVLIEQALDVARPVDTLVTFEGVLYRSTNAAVATYVAMGGFAPASLPVRTGTAAIGSIDGTDEVTIDAVDIGEDYWGNPAWAIRSAPDGGGSEPRFVQLVYWNGNDLVIRLDDDVGGDQPDVAVRWFVLGDFSSP